MFRPLAVATLSGAILALSCGGDLTRGAPDAGASGSATASPSGAAPATQAALPGGPPVGRPVSFAALVEGADAAVATVRSVARSSQGGDIVVEGIGTAFVFDAAKGLLLTNHHVVDPQKGLRTEISVGFPSGADFRATVVGSDKATDVAVIKVAQEGLPELPLGDSDVIKIGEWVVAIGNPFGLTHTVSAGILSAKGRTRDDVSGLDPNGYFYFLQTDASINPGSSGGPLLDLEGRVVGINSAVRQNANGIGFAIPINMVKQLIPMLLAEGRVRRSALGVSVFPLDAEDVAKLGRKDRRGALVRQLLPGGPGERAGLAVDDIILAFEGTPIADPNDLRWSASMFGVGKTAKIRVARGAREFDLQVELGALETP